MELRPMTVGDWPAVRAIYEAGIATGDATFETRAPDWAAWNDEHLEHPRLVAVDDTSAVVGWVALASYSDRCVYRGVAWVSVYVAPGAQGQGIGRALLQAVIEASEAAGIWTLQAGILPENAASLGLHERCGFRLVGVRERMGRDAKGHWRDVLLLERRSTVAGA